jgi:ribosome-binding factor A
MNKRPAQVASELHRAIQQVFDRGLQDPRISGVMLTVTDVRVSQDIRNATVMLSVMPQEHDELAMHGVRAAAAHIRREAGNLLALRRTPDLIFKLDRSIRKQADVLGAIARATAEREAAEQARAQGDTAPQPGPDQPPQP